MSRKLIVAIAAVAALGLSTLASTGAFARGGGGHGGGGHGGGHFSSGHGGGMSRASFHGRSTAARTVNRHVTRTVNRGGSHVNKTRHAGRGPIAKRPHQPHRHHIARHHHRHHWWWCRHHPYRCGGSWGGVDIVGVDGGLAPIPVAAAPVVAATSAAAVCTNECDYFLKDEPGCYMAKRAFSTPVGDELRCVKICDEAEGKRAELK
jgi:hypothetical protein